MSFRFLKAFCHIYSYSVIAFFRLWNEQTFLRICNWSASQFAFLTIAFLPHPPTRKKWLIGSASNARYVFYWRKQTKAVEMWKKKIDSRSYVISKFKIISKWNVNFLTTTLFSTHSSNLQMKWKKSVTTELLKMLIWLSFCRHMLHSNVYFKILKIPDRLHFISAKAKKQKFLRFRMNW